MIAKLFTYRQGSSTRRDRADEQRPASVLRHSLCLFVAARHVASRSRSRARLASRPERVNGRFDFLLPEEGTQIPMSRLLGTADARKRRVVYDTGHNIPRPDLIRESLDWLDTHLGPVRQSR